MVKKCISLTSGMNVKTRIERLYKTLLKTFESSQTPKCLTACAETPLANDLCLDWTNRDYTACLAQQSSLPGGNQLAVWPVVRYLQGLCWLRCWPCLPDALFPQVSTLQLAAPGSCKPTGPLPETCWMMPEPENCTDQYVSMHCIEPTHWTRQTSTDKQPQTAHFILSGSCMAPLQLIVNTLVCQWLDH